jgi:hypothetical protein
MLDASTAVDWGGRDKARGRGEEVRGWRLESASLATACASAGWRKEGELEVRSVGAGCSGMRLGGSGEGRTVRGERRAGQTAPRG